MKTIILGMGNTLFSDDGAGIAVAQRLGELIPQNGDIAVRETSWGGLRLLDLLSGYDRAVIIDAIQTGQKAPGYIHRFSPGDFVHSVRMVSFHDLNFATVLEFAKRLGIPMPEEISVYAIEVEETEVMAERMTPAACRAVEECARNILAEIGDSGCFNWQLPTGNCQLPIKKISP